MAATGASLFATVRRFFSFSHQTGALAVKANLPGRKNIDRLSYRQKNQAKALATSRDPVYRLLAGAIGLSVRRMRRSAWVSALPMHRTLDRLVHELNRLHPENLKIKGATT